MINIKSLKKRYILILMLLAMIASVSSASALDVPMITGKNIYDAEIVKTKNTTSAVVNLNEKVSFTVSTNNTDNVEWNFGDKTKIINTKTINSVSTTTHTFKKVGTYQVLVNLRGSGVNVVDLDFITVKVVKKPDLVLTKLNFARQGKDIVGFEATVTNKGNKASKACFMQMWYENPKFKQYTKSVKIPALKAGKNASVIIAFQMLYKYRNQIKYIKIDSTNKIDESIKSNNQKRLNDLIKM